MSNLKARLRDFVETEEGYFAVNTYQHPNDRIIAFLRYINLNKLSETTNKEIDELLSIYNLDKNDIRVKLDETGRELKFIKVADSKTAYDILQQNYPIYVYYDSVNDVVLHAIPYNNVKQIISPKDRLKEIINNPQTLLEEKCKKLAEKLKECGQKNNLPIDYENMGVSGSTIPKLNNEGSDIDFVIYGMKNHKIARKILKECFEDGEIAEITPLSEDFWKKAYKKRIKDDTLEYDEFVWHELRKYNRGSVNGTMFDLLATREWDEINDNYGDKSYKNKGFIKINANIKDDDYMFDNPATYSLENVELGNYEGNMHLNEIKEIKENSMALKEVVSFTHTYAGQCLNNENVSIRGKLEAVESPNCENYYRVVVGTTREAFNEYIKLNKN
ncbi:hypothetical protein [Methanococcus voltae]|uniref:Polymerase nucleotidyl transferase domain-containing protein n=1 Tax=Methanococcus voltae (strain ATCC BAA-1334 / A3) TaxID=456320 RepID=D7DT23_METV3|nr:hypothetical protein [Methanococcus voltae]MCS3901941.1 putative nucleotidyltransferase [Methanococcus voltae]